MKKQRITKNIMAIAGLSMINLTLAIQSNICTKWADIFKCHCIFIMVTYKANARIYGQKIEQ